MADVATVSNDCARLIPTAGLYSIDTASSQHRIASAEPHLSGPLAHHMNCLWSLGYGASEEPGLSIMNLLWNQPVQTAAKDFTDLGPCFFVAEGETEAPVGKRICSSGGGPCAAWPGDCGARRALAISHSSATQGKLS